MIENKGNFSQNFHYKLEIDNYDKNKNYDIVVVPGGGAIGTSGQGKTSIADPGNEDKSAITLPSKIVEEDGKYYIEFDYFITGGSSSPVYGKVRESDD